MPTPLEAQLRQMTQSLDLRPEDIDTADVLPVFVPASFFALGNWPGPHARLRAGEIGLTWTVLFPNQTMRYVNFETQNFWEARQLDWKALALRNLSLRSNEKPGVREIRRTTGETSALAFVFEDGLGPSRLLFRKGLSERFPGGYRVAMPEMSCGLAFAKDLHGQDMATVQGVIDHCYKHGTRPLAAGSYDPDELLPVDQGA